jgi:hypothetical protein
MTGVHGWVADFMAKPDRRKLDLLCCMTGVHGWVADFMAKPDRRKRGTMPLLRPGRVAKGGWLLGGEEDRAVTPTRAASTTMLQRDSQT